MNCAFDKEKLTGYYDGELEAAEKAEVERHIASCSECLRELGELKSAAILVKELPRMRAPRSIAEGVTREIQAAGKVHRFSQVRRSVLWAGAVAAAAFVALNVAYFSQASKDAPAGLAAAAKKPSAAPTMANVPMEQEREAGQKEAKEEKTARRLLDRMDEKEAGRAAEGRKRVGDDEKKDGLPKNEDSALRGEPLPRPDAAKDKSAAPFPKAADAKAPLAEAPAPGAPPATVAKPTAAPPPAPAPIAGKELAKPVEAPAEKAQELKKSAEGLGKSDADPKAKRPADPQAEAAPTNLTIASTQLTKARPVMEETLRKMGVRIPAAPSGAMKGQAGKLREESTLSVELTDSQIARLRQELEKLGHSRLVVGSPGDPVLAQFGPEGLYRGKKEVASGGAAAPARKAADAPKPETAKVESKEKDKDGKEAEDQPGAKAFAAAGEPEPKRKVLLHLLEVTVIPDPQPAGDPVKK